MFQHDGAEYLVVLAGGTALGSSKRADGLWLFSLDGTLGPLPRGAADPAGQFPRPGGGPPGSAPLAQAAAPTARARPGDLAKSQEIYTTTCVVCHGASGQGGTHGGARLTGALTRDAITSVVALGRHDMPAFGAALKPDELQDLADYVLQLVASPPATH